MSNIKYVVSFDIGKKNFAFCISKIYCKKVEKLKKIVKKDRYNKDGTPTESFQKELTKLYKCSKIDIVRNLDLTENCDKKKYLDDLTYLNLIDVLDEYKKYWDKCDHILIEKQMSFRGKFNVMAMKIAQFVFAYFKIHYRDTKPIIDYPAYHKTQVLGAKKDEVKQKPKRKKWAINKTRDILTMLKDENALIQFNANKKKDDVSDCMLMNVTYIYLHYIDHFY